jgi:glutamate/tyrosine decarboxylase-like PLP-dependent enzyme
VNAAKLELSPEEMRALAGEMIEMLVAHNTGLADGPVLRSSRRERLNELLWEDIPRHPSRPEDVLRRVRDQVLSSLGYCEHPRFFAFVPGPSNFVGVIADAMSNGFNVINECWLESSAATVVELVTIDWIRKLAGMPDSAGGIFTSGGSMANLTALAAARETKLPAEARQRGVVYFSSQTHSSIAKGLRIIGFLPDQLRVLGTDSEFRLRPDELREAVARDRAAGLVPFCVVANAGTTNTGAIDPLGAAADICAEQNMWLHVDGAYGGGALFCERGRGLLAGLGRVDSFSVDPHKWLFQPFDCGCLIVRDRECLRESFHAQPEYLRDAAGSVAEPNLWDYGPELTRPFRALKLWMSLQVFGAEAFDAAIERGFLLAETAERELRSRPGWEIVTPAQMAIVTFRREGSDEVNQAIADRMKAEGFALVLSTVLEGRKVLRMCTINPRTTDDDIKETVRRLDSWHA